MDSSVFRDAYVCIFNYLEMRKKERKPIGGYVFVRLDFFFITREKNPHFYMTMKELFKG